jgi:hypothetical protein
MAATNGAIHGPLIELFEDVFAARYRVPLPQINA